MTGIPKIVANRLLKIESVAQDSAEAHPDEDLLNAFAEQALSTTEREMVLGHLSTCGDCREIVALAMPIHAASVPSPVVAVKMNGLRENSEPRERAEIRFAGTREPARARNKNSWFGFARPNLAWGALAAGVAVAASMVILHPLQQRQAHAPVAAIAAQLPASTAASPSTASAPSIDPRTSTNDTKPAASAPRKQRRLENKTRSVSNLDVLAENKMPASSSPWPSSGSAPAIQKAKPALQSQSAANASVVAQGLGPAWQIADGSLQRSVDDGKTWQLAAQADAALLCYASRNNEVWAGGQQGTLLHSSDGGQTWSKVRPSVAYETLNADITRIDLSRNSESDLPATASVIQFATTNGEIWASQDNGKSWNKN